MHLFRSVVYRTQKQNINQLNFNKMKKNSKNSKLVKVTKKASQILEAQKKDYHKIVGKNIKKYGFKKGAKEGASEYRKTYGGTPRQRWENAMKKAERSCK